MIEKLKEHSVGEIKKSLGDTFGELFGPVITHPLPPTDEEIINKINEIVDYLNRKEANEQN